MWDPVIENEIQGFFIHSFNIRKTLLGANKINLSQNVFTAHFFFLKILFINFKQGLQPFCSENACLVISPVQSIDKLFPSIVDRVTYLIHGKLRFFPPLKQDSKVNFLRHLTVKQQASIVKLRTRLKGQQHEMVYWLNLSHIMQLERILNKFKFVLLLTVFGT